MKVAIDISQIVYETGVSTYTKNLIENLIKLDSENEYIFFAGSLRKADYIRSYLNDNLSSTKNVILPMPPTLSSFLWNRLHILPVEALMGKIDIFHSSDWTQPPTRAKKVTTVHDLSPILLPELSTKKVVETHKRRLSWVKKEVDRIIAPTVATKNDLINWGVRDSKIIVIPEAVDAIYKKVNEKEVVNMKLKYNIQGDYVLSVGTNKRKNNESLIKAMRLNKSGYKLVITGTKPQNVTDDITVQYLGHVDIKDMPGLYTGAKALVYPSIYEGFGLPILESFACETPVVCSKIPSLEEVGGDACVFINPNDVNEISSSIDLAIKNSHKLIEKGKGQLRKYSWEKTAKLTIDVYNELK